MVSRWMLRNYRSLAACRNHDHGLPTSPRVTENTGAGNYRLQGIRFHMKGNWQIIISIFEGPTVDRVVIDLKL